MKSDLKCCLSYLAVKHHDLLIKMEEKIFKRLICLLKCFEYFLLTVLEVDFRLQRNTNFKT